MIQFKDVTAGYGKEEILKHINIIFPKGSITSIIGPNGSGKSTLLKSIVGLCNITAGDIYLQDKPKSEIGTKAFARLISYLPQNHSLPSITTERMVLHGRFPYLDYPRRYRAEDFTHCQKAMEQVGIWHLRDRQLDELSGGERQKAYLAMALAGETEVFLLDEPTSYLDILYQLELLRIMQELRDTGKTIITILHDLNFALGISDQVIAMKNGTILECALPAKLYETKVIDKLFHVQSHKFTDHNRVTYYYFQPVS